MDVSSERERGGTPRRGQLVREELHRGKGEDEASQEGKNSLPLNERGEGGRGNVKKAIFACILRRKKDCR